jgi:hypothetical protein
VRRGWRERYLRLELHCTLENYFIFLLQNRLAKGGPGTNHAEKHFLCWVKARATQEKHRQDPPLTRQHMAYIFLKCGRNATTMCIFYFVQCGSTENASNQFYYFTSLDSWLMSTAGHKGFPPPLRVSTTTPTRRQPTFPRS